MFFSPFAAKQMTGYGRHEHRFPVHKAAHGGHLELIKLFLQTSYDFNQPFGGYSVFSAACESGQTDIVKLLILSSTKHGINLNDGAFHVACKHYCSEKGGYFNNIETVKVLVDHSTEYGIELNTQNWFGETAIWDALLPDDDHEDLGDNEVLRFLIECPKIDVTAGEENVLHYACREGFSKGNALI